MSNISFNGRIKFVNKESYKNFITHRSEIRNLKHHCGNNSLAHIIQHDKDYFVITTDYKHEMKIDGTTSHTLSDVTIGADSSKINKIVKLHISKVKNWKWDVDKIPQSVPKAAEISKSMSIVQKIFKFFNKNACKKKLACMIKR